MLQNIVQLNEIPKIIHLILIQNIENQVKSQISFYSFSLFPF